MRYCIYLDDTRDPPPDCKCGGLKDGHAGLQHDGACDLPICECLKFDSLWTVFRTAEAMLAFIEEVGMEAIAEISFDNDLGFGNMEGYQALNVIEEKVYHGAPLPILRVHSDNCGAGPRMRKAIEGMRARSMDRSTPVTPIKSMHED